MVFLHKLLGVGVILNLPDMVKLLVFGFGVNPFVVGMKHMNAFQMACDCSNVNLVKFFGTTEYSYLESKMQFDKQQKLCTKNKFDNNTGLHYASLKDNSEVYQVALGLCDEAAKEINSRNWLPHECSKMEAMKVKEKDYLYVIICRDVEEDPNKTLVYDQIQRLNEMQMINYENEMEHMIVDGDQVGFGNNFAKTEVIVQDFEHGDGGEEIFQDKIVMGENTIPNDEEEVFEDEIIIAPAPNFYELDAQQEEEDRIEMKGVNIQPPEEARNTPLIIDQKEHHQWIEYEGEVLFMKWIKLTDHKSKSRKFYRHCYLLGIKEEAMEGLADLFNLKIFNKKKQYLDYFVENKSKSFENFRDSQKQKLILYLINKEIDLQEYKSRGIVESIFPIHDEQKQDHLKRLWKDKWVSGLVHNVSPSENDISTLDPYNALNFYQGSDIALYTGFNGVYTSWLLLLGIFGLIIEIMAQASGYDSDNKLLPIFAAFVSLIVTLADQFWTRRQSEFSMLWETREFKANELPCPKFRGHFTIDKIRREITIQSSWSASSKMILSNIVMIIFGVGLIIANFILFYYINKEIHYSRKQGDISKAYAKYLGGLAGVANGASIFVLSNLFIYLTDKIVLWENHEYKSDRLMSKVPKVFFFNFSMNYINLFFYAFYLQDFIIFQSNFISIFITKILLHFGLINLVPWLIFVVRKYMLKKRTDKIIQERLSFTNNPDQEEQYKKEIALLAQIELDSIRPEPASLENAWLNYMVQFGFISFFSIAFPLAPLIAVLFNVADLHFVFYAYSSVMRRKQVIELDGIGVWNEIIKGMTIISLFVNIALFNWCSTGFKDLLHIKNDYLILFGLILYEHLVFALKYIASVMIPNEPQWVQNQIKIRKTKKEMYESSENESRLIKEQLKDNLRTAKKCQDNHNQLHKKESAKGAEMKEEIVNESSISPMVGGTVFNFVKNKHMREKLDALNLDEDKIEKFCIDLEAQEEDEEDTLRKELTVITSEESQRVDQLEELQETFVHELNLGPNNLSL